jgi:hypothetical protein
VFQTSGAKGAWDIQGGVGVSRNLTITGRGGGVLKTINKKPKTIESAADAVRFLERSLAFNAAGLLRKEASAQYSAWIKSWVVQQVDEGVLPQDIPDAFFFHHWFRRWYGESHQAQARLEIDPLLSLGALRAAYREGIEHKRLTRIHFELMRRCSPRLAKMPFALHVWSSELYEDLPDAADYRAAQPYTGSGSAPPLWKALRLQANRAIFERYLVDDHANPIFTILNRARVAEAVRGDRPLSTTESQLLFGALAAAIWLGGHEDTGRFGDMTATRQPALQPSVLQDAARNEEVTTPAHIGELICRE